MKNTEERCAEIYAAEGHPLAGSAVEVDRWLLIEVRETWEAKAPVDNGLSPQVNKWLEKTLLDGSEKGIRVRPQFIRRRSKATDGLHVFVASIDGLCEFEIDSHEDLCSVDVFDLSLDSNAQDCYFVCTHARRDMCCSRLGIPVWQALEDRFPGRTWQTSHLGGHRFAANVLILPSGLVLGQVRIENLDSILNRLSSDEIPYEHLRGRSYLPVEAQASESNLRGKFRSFESFSNEQVVFQTDLGKEVLTPPPAQDRMILASCGAERKLTKIFVENL